MHFNLSFTLIYVSVFMFFMYYVFTGPRDNACPFVLTVMGF